MTEHNISLHEIREQFGPADITVIACNYTQATNVVSNGSKAYVDPVYLGGNLPERMRVLVRSRSGRWIEKWEDTRRLSNFRLKTIPPQHARYHDLAGYQATQKEVDLCKRALQEVLP